MSAADGHEPPEQDLEVRETFKLASEFAPHVTMTEETFFSHGWQPLTITVLQSLWFLPSDAAFDIPFLVDWYARLGWKGANGKPLGANVVRREIGLIRDAGYVTVVRLRGESGQAVGIQYSVSQRRADQPQSGAWVPVLPGTEENRRSHHVPPMPTHGESPHVANGEKPSSGHVPPMTTRGESPHAVNGAKPQVAPRATNGVSPPHPPEGEVGTTSPSPQHAGKPRRDKQSTPDVDSGAAAVARDFLMKLPGDWAVGLERAKNLAPWLVHNAELTGWPLDLSLRLYLTRAEPEKGPIKNYGATLAYRIKEMQHRDAFLAAKAAQGDGQAPADGAAPGKTPWCGECESDSYRWFTPVGGPARKCPTCHPSATRRRTGA